MSEFQRMAHIFCPLLTCRGILWENVGVPHGPSRPRIRLDCGVEF